ncbi:unnamed protein product, partial [Penicillium discolor]
MRRLGVLQAGAQLRVGADRIEVAESDGPDVARGRGIGEDLLDHGLGGGVRAGGSDAAALVDPVPRLPRIDRGGRAEDDALDAGITETPEQDDRPADVGVVVPERVRHGLRHDDTRGAVHDRVDVRMIAQQAVEDRRVGDVAHVQLAPRPESGEARGEVVQQHDLDPGLQARGRHGRSDVAGPAGDQYLHR